jgi:hypothetical protein
MDDAENAAPEERVTVADVRLLVDSRNVMQHFADGELSDHATIALYGLAHGLTHDWWSIFGGRDREFSLLNYRSGYLLPDVRFWFDGSAFEVEVQEKAYRDPDLRFWGGMKQTLSREEGEAALGGMIEMILTRLKAKGIEGTSAQLRWKRVQHSRKSGELRFCETAGSLGLDPYAIEDDAADFIERAEQIFEPEPLMEFAAGAKGAKPAPLLDWVDRMRRFRGFRYRLADLGPMAKQVERDTPQKAGEAAWAVGYRRARKMRKALNMSQNDRLASYRELAKLLGGGASYNIADHVDGIKALRSEREDGIQIHLRSQGQTGDARSGHLFALARAVGDVVCFPKSALAPINDAHHAYRQAAGRAFAAEFLAPIDEIRSMIRDRKDLVTIASTFSVSSAVIEHQVENRKRIDTACSEGVPASFC